MEAGKLPEIRKGTSKGKVDCMWPVTRSTVTVVSRGVGSVAAQHLEIAKLARTTATGK
jgi:hypothetical protein